MIPKEVLRRREERLAEKAALEQAKKDGIAPKNPISIAGDTSDAGRVADQSVSRETGLHPDRVGRVEDAGRMTEPRKISNKQQRRLALYEPRPVPPKPTIPDGILIPEGEENWLSLWDLPEDQVERRVTREKKRKAAERKALRLKQQSGKVERRAARDEKRRVYREIKLEWKAIKGQQFLTVCNLGIGDADNNTEEQARQRTKLKSLEDEESKKIAVQINTAERKAAMDLCTSLGFTIENTPGTTEIKPKALGMKGVDVDFDAIEKAEKQGNIQLRQDNSKSNSKRVDLGKSAADTKTEHVSTAETKVHPADDEFIRFDVGDGQDFQTLNYNHKLRRKLRRAIDNAEIRKEMLVRDRAVEYFKEKGEEIPLVLLTSSRPLNIKGHRILDNGKLETAKQERVRARVELTEFNIQMKVLRRQAKDAAVYAGLEKHAQLTGKIKESAEQGQAAVSSTVDLPVDGRSGNRKRSLSDSEDTTSDIGSESLGATSVSEAGPDSADSKVLGRIEHSAKRRKI